MCVGHNPEHSSLEHFYITGQLVRQPQTFLPSCLHALERKEFTRLGVGWEFVTPILL